MTAFYVVRVGRRGPQIYTSLKEAKQNACRWPGATVKRFHNLEQAQQWLGEIPIPMVPHTPQGVQCGPANQPPQLPASADPIQAANTADPYNLAQEIQLSPEQQAVLRIVESGKSVFFTGSAGTGKSVLLRKIIASCGGPTSEQLAITASTGIASVNIGGCTLHSWAGIGLGKESKEKLVGKILGQDKHQREKDEQARARGEYVPEKQSRVKDRWCKVKTLIIDEISMIDGILFDKLEYIGRVLRKNDQPFGGIQLVLSGDFCQLPPVPDTTVYIHRSSMFAFDAESWNRCVGKPMVLHRVFRQKDPAFIDMLNAMRLGRLTSEITAAFRALSRPVVYNDGIEPTDLYPTRREVDNANHSRLNRLSGQAHLYRATDIPGCDAAGMPIPYHKIQPLLERLVAPKDVLLKEGAQVMLIKNLVQGRLVNGSVGRVVAFSAAAQAIRSGAQIAQTEGGGGLDRNKIPEDLLKSDRIWPVVQFQDGSVVLCLPSTFEVNNAEGNVEARREQIPLILAWALSIHKSQGQTLERVRVNLGRIFEKGQAYVALSRATNMASLQVLKFDPSKVMAHQHVLEWMRDISDVGRW